MLRQLCRIGRLPTAKHLARRLLAAPAAVTCSTQRLLPGRRFHDDADSSRKPQDATTGTRSAAAAAAEGTVPTAVAAKYQAFRDSDATVIFDVDEERQKAREAELRAAEEADALDVAGDELETDATGAEDIYAGLNMQRGQSGVFEIADLVAVLRRDHADDLFVCQVPAALKYVDHICVVTGRSQRHRLAIAQFVRKMYKLKRHPGEPIPRIEGERSQDWMALDLGNIALHIFSPEARKLYDLESLWTVGAEFDAECQKPADELVELYEKNSIYLADLMPNRSG